MDSGENGEASDYESEAIATSADLILPYSVDDLDVRGRVAYLGAAVDKIVKGHNYPEPVSRLLAEAITLNSLLADSIKLNGRLILQTQTDGAVPMIVADYRSPGSIRAYARYDKEKFGIGEAVQSSEIQNLLGKGYLAITIDHGSNMSRYQGMVALDGTSFEEAAHLYFEQSEQIPTIIRLAVSEVFTRNSDGGTTSGWQAGGILAQFLPENSERMRAKDLDPGDDPSGGNSHEHPEDDAWVEAKSLVHTVADDELTDPEMTAEKLLFRLFHNREVRVFPPNAVAAKCPCDRESISAMLRSFKPDERKDMVVAGKISVTCEFCNSTYEFAPGDLQS